jgi:hypothetical protein
MIKHLNMTDEVVKKSGKLIHLFEVPPAAIKEVIFGIKIMPKTRTDIESKLRFLLAHIVIKQATIDPKKGLEIM